MSERDTLAVVRRHLSDWLEPGFDLQRIVGPARLREDLGLSSLDAVSLLMAVEEELSIEVTDEELATLVTVGDLVSLLDRKEAELA